MTGAFDIESDVDTFVRRMPFDASAAGNSPSLLQLEAPSRLQLPEAPSRLQLPDVSCDIDVDGDSEDDMCGLPRSGLGDILDTARILNHGQRRIPKGQKKLELQPRRSQG